MSEEAHLLVERRPDGVMILTMNRPGARNALSPQMLVLMAEGREVGNTELFDKYGFRIPAPVRALLGELGLLTERREGSARLLHPWNPYVLSFPRSNVCHWGHCRGARG